MINKTINSSICFFLIVLWSHQNQHCCEARRLGAPEKNLQAFDSEPEEAQTPIAKAPIQLRGNRPDAPEGLNARSPEGLIARSAGNQLDWTPAEQVSARGKSRFELPDGNIVVIGNEHAQEPSQPIIPKVQLDVLPLRDEQGRRYLTGIVFLGQREIPLRFTELKPNAGELQVELEAGEFRGVRAIVPSEFRRIRLLSNEIKDLETSMVSPVPFFGFVGVQRWGDDRDEIGRPTELSGLRNDGNRQLRNDSIISASSVIAAGLSIGLAAIGPGIGGGRRRAAWMLGEEEPEENELEVAATAFANTENLFAGIQSVALLNEDGNRRRQLSAVHDEKEDMIRFEVNLKN